MGIDVEKYLSILILRMECIIKTEESPKSDLNTCISYNFDVPSTN